MAVGAQGKQVLALVVRGALRPVVAGLALGVIGALLRGEIARDTPLSRAAGRPAGGLAGMAGMLGAWAIAASLVPARRASRLEIQMPR